MKRKTISLNKFIGECGSSIHSAQVNLRKTSIIYANRLDTMCPPSFHHSGSEATCVLRTHSIYKLMLSFCFLLCSCMFDMHLKYYDSS